MASLVIANAMQQLVQPGTLVLSERISGLRDVHIVDTDDIARHKKYLVGWQGMAAEEIVLAGGQLKISDSSRLQRQVKHARDAGDEALYLELNWRRDFKLGSSFAEASRAFDKVIGIYGLLHVLSPVFKRLVSPVAHSCFVLR